MLTLVLQVNDSDDPSHEWVDEDQSKQPICVTRWRNATPDQRKKMFAIFQQSGVFIACCRHRFVLLGCDMIKSGELSVYVVLIRVNS